MKAKLVMLFIVGCLLFPNQAYSYIFDTGEPFKVGTRPSPVGYDPEVIDVRHYAFDPSQSFAGQFHLDQAYKISSIEGFMALSDDYSQELMYNVSIYADGDDVPDVTKKLFSQTRSRVFTTAEGYQWDGVSGLDFDLEQGAYWLAFEPVSFRGFMPGPSPHPLANEASVSQTGGPFDGIYQPSDDLDLAFRMDGRAISSSPTVTPEPATLLLMGGGLLGAFYRRQKIKSAKV